MTERLRASPLFLLVGVAASVGKLDATLSSGNIRRRLHMATKETAKSKFVESVTSTVAPRKMATKLSTYLGETVTESAAPIQNWVKIVSVNAAELFEKCYENMKKAYK